MAKERILFVTGKLAEKGLLTMLDKMHDDSFIYKIEQIGVNVAALMTTALIQKRLVLRDNFSKILLPGRCQVDLQGLSEHFGIPVEKGPEELIDLPEFFKQDPQLLQVMRDSSMRIMGEIYGASSMSVDEIVSIATQFHRDGADVIDIGCSPDKPFKHLEEVIKVLRAKKYEVSVDSLNPEELLRGANAGANYLLSLSESTVDIAAKTDAIPVIIPETETDYASLKRAIQKMEALKKPYIADALLRPSQYGLAKSIARYVQLRQDFPEAEILMGIGNVVELIGADSVGVNTLLLAMAAELNINYLLTSQVSPHSRSSIRESVAAKSLASIAQQLSSWPMKKNPLMILHELNPHPYSKSEVVSMAKAIKDPSYRIQVTEDALHLFNRDGLHSGTDPFALFDKIDLDKDVSHAFYLGYEFAKAEIARQLGKRYVQDQPLNWGCAAQPSKKSKKD